MVGPGRGRAPHVKAPFRRNGIRCYSQLSVEARLCSRLHPEPVKMNDQPSGEATVDLWTVVFDAGNNPKRAIIIGTLAATSERFIAARTLSEIARPTSPIPLS